MVASRDQAKREFSERLHEALDELARSEGCPPRHERGRTAWVARRYGVSGEGAGKWLDGRVLPDQTNIARIAADLRVTPQWLQAGQLPKRPMEDAPDLKQLRDVWHDLDETGRHQVLEFAALKAGYMSYRQPINKLPVEPSSTEAADESSH